MNARSRNLPRRVLATVSNLVLGLTPAVAFALLNGRAIQQMLDLGQLVTVNTIVDELGADDTLLDGLRSWAGRHIASMYRLLNGRSPLKAWVRHRTTGRWIHVFVYCPGEAAIEKGLRSYPRTSHLVPARVLEVA